MASARIVRYFAAMETQTVVSALAALAAIIAAVAAWRGVAEQKRLAGQREDFETRQTKQRESFEIRQMKLSALRKFTGNRAALSGTSYEAHQPDFYEALNEVIVAFSDSSVVVAAVEKLREARDLGRGDDELLRLFKLMCADLKIDLRDFDDSLFVRVFQPNS